MRNEQRRGYFLTSRAWLRLILGRYLGTDAASVRFTVTDRGKPSIVDGSDLCFSLSRSGRLALVALTTGRAVGVDIERVSSLDHDGLAGRFFSPAEAASLRSLPEADRLDGFYELWVRKEAVVKATGTGIGDGLDHIDVRGSRVAGIWSVETLDAGPGFAAAVAVEGTLGPITTRATQPEALCWPSLRA